jgi:hypothetical protein
MHGISDATQLATAQNKVFDVYNKVRGVGGEAVPCCHRQGEGGITQSGLPVLKFRALRMRMASRECGCLRFYPPELQRINVAGTARVRIMSPLQAALQLQNMDLIWSPGAGHSCAAGCVEMQLYPASVGGKAVEASEVLPVRFILLDSPRPSAP